MSKVSQVRQHREAIEHERQQSPVTMQMAPGETGIDSLVPMLIQGGQKIQYGVDSGITSDGTPYVCIALGVGPIRIPCSLSLNEARAFVQKLDRQIAQCEPAPNPGETEGNERTTANVSHSRIIFPG